LIIKLSARIAKVGVPMLEQQKPNITIVSTCGYRKKIIPSSPVVHQWLKYIAGRELHEGCKRHSDAAVDTWSCREPAK
jgi:hypothetical protein